VDLETIKINFVYTSPLISSLPNQNLSLLF